uniref:phytase n=1 Tax=Vibrio harveyi TaxID=669 RepID=UPI000B23478C
MNIQARNNSLFILPYIFLIAGCQEENKVSIPVESKIIVEATIETERINIIGDSIDDPAVWFNELIPENSMIFASNKQGGILSYDMDGHFLYSQNLGKVNNIDIQKNINFEGLNQDLMIGTNRSNNSVILLKVNGFNEPLELLHEFHLDNFGEVYGVCAKADKSSLIALVTSKRGDVKLLQYDDLVPEKVKVIWSFKFNTQVEGCSFDHYGKKVYVGEEDYGIWVSMSDKPDFTPFYSIDKEYLVPDVEGISAFNYKGKD